MKVGGVFTVFRKECFRLRDNTVRLRKKFQELLVSQVKHGLESVNYCMEHAQILQIVQNQPMAKVLFISETNC